MAALDDPDIEPALQIADSRRQRRLRDIEARGGAAEMLLARQRDEIFKLSQQHRVDREPLRRRIAGRATTAIRGRGAQ